MKWRRGKADRLRWAAAVLCAALLSHAGLAAAKHVKAHRASHSDQREIVLIEDSLRTALLTNNPVILDKTLSDDFVGISANGKVSDKQQYLRRVAGKEHQFTQINIVDRKIRVERPTTAVVVTTANVVGTLDGMAVQGLYRYTRVYVKQANGVWKVVNSEATRVSGPQSADDLHHGTPMKE